MGAPSVKEWHETKRAGAKRRLFLFHSTNDCVTLETHVVRAHVVTCWEEGRHTIEAAAAIDSSAAKFEHFIPCSIEVFEEERA